MSLAQSISIGLTSQQIIQLGQLCYPIGTQLFKHPWTDERSCKTSLHAADICWWQSTFECIIQYTVTGDEIGQVFFCLWNRGSSMNKYSQNILYDHLSLTKKNWNKSTPLKDKQILVGGFQPVWKICASHIGSFCHGLGWKFKKNALKLPRKFSCHAPHNLQPHETPFFPRHMAARNSFSASLFLWEVNGSDLFLNFFVGHVVFRGSELRTFR